MLTGQFDYQYDVFRFLVISVYQSTNQNIYSAIILFINELKDACKSKHTQKNKKPGAEHSR